MFVGAAIPVLAALLLGANAQVHYFQPEQIHLSFGATVEDIVVTWSTFNDTKESIVEYGIGGMVLKAYGNSTVFVDGGKNKHTQYIHRVTLPNLNPKSKYVYHCGSNLGWSPMFWFNTVQNDEDWQPRLAIYGDMGNENAQSLVRLQEETQRGQYDAILHVGDFAYDMNTDNAAVGDQFMRQIESIAGYLPYMTCPGNHEEKYNFSNYRNRFSMPQGTDNMMYSFNLGPLHIISISTEVYYFMNYGLKPLVNQYLWLENDLVEANLPENREKRPWIVVMGHRPMYCSNEDSDDCTHHETLTRVGLPFLHFFGLEKLLYDYGVDLNIWAHEHSYERLWPIYDYKVYNGSYDRPYVNPGAPVHIVTGSAGCKEGTDGFVANKPEWSAFSNSDYGYTRLKAFNKTHLYIEQVSDNKSGAIVDSFWIVKNFHGPYKNSQMDWAKLDSMRLKNF
ncbi:PREDICTED: acid phosphatase type 7 [Nicrophorus vespilloides]|uniref:Purple acid phosphatase n=1 Tax=Nicrophorus vespilloides TaxID=110193 RepID=A0ABM1M910_NICVS|nr:PREDICTED: acid phosphatase type 7 [Nicrophorus vespilloides]